MVTWLGHYWAATGGNIEAMPLQAAITVVATLLLRKHVARWWHRIVGDKADLEDVKRMAEAAQRIAADLFEHHTGQQHEAAPGRREEDR